MNRAMKLASITMALAALLGGCYEQPAAPATTQTAAPVPAPQPAKPKESAQAPYLAKAAVKSDVDAPENGAVDSAIMWAEKYGKAVENLSATQDKLRQMSDDKAVIQRDLEKTRLELAQAQKELTDANTMLLEMKSELDKWKKDVLGNRNEMMKAHAAELDALRKIMKVLGSELADNPGIVPNAGQSAPGGEGETSATPAPATQPAASKAPQGEENHAPTH